MDLLEFQGKQLFARVGVPVPEGRVAATPAEARKAAEELGGKVAVKAQVRIGGRGKRGHFVRRDVARHGRFCYSARDESALVVGR